MDGHSPSSVLQRFWMTSLHPPRHNREFGWCFIFEQALMGAFTPLTEQFGVTTICAISIQPLGKGCLKGSVIAYWKRAALTSVQCRNMTSRAQGVIGRRRLLLFIEVNTNGTHWNESPLVGSESTNNPVETPK